MRYRSAVDADFYRHDIVALVKKEMNQIILVFKKKVPTSFFTELVHLTTRYHVNIKHSKPRILAENNFKSKQPS